MKRVTIIFMSLFFISAIAQATPPIQLYQKGVSYQEIAGAESTYQGDKVDVLEMLWYGCQSCYMIQGDLEQWVEGSAKVITYRRMPAVTDDNMILLARTFYAAEVLGVMDKVHKPLFTAIHDAKRQMTTEEQVGEFFEEQGVSSKDFFSALNSNYVNGKLRRARMMSSRYGIKGAPSVIVDGKYLVDPSMVTSPRQFVAVINFLVNKVRTTVRP